MKPNPTGDSQSAAMAKIKTLCGYDADAAELAAKTWNSVAVHEGEDEDAQLTIESALHLYSHRFKQRAEAAEQNVKTLRDAMERVQGVLSFHSGVWTEALNATVSRALAATAPAKEPETFTGLPHILAMCEEARQRMNSYTPEQRAELEAKGREIIASGAPAKEGA